jgi:hypothetical protein
MPTKKKTKKKLAPGKKVSKVKPLTQDLHILKPTNTPSPHM